MINFLSPILLFILSVRIANAVVGTEPMEIDDDRKAAEQSEMNTLCAKHDTNFKELYHENNGQEILWEEGEKEDKQREEEEEQKMDIKNGQWLSTFLGKYLCQKLRDDKQPKTGKSQAKLDYEQEKDVWWRPANESKTKPQGFGVRAEKLFERIRGKFGISDGELLVSLSKLKPLKSRGGSGAVFYISEDGKFIIKSLNREHDEPEKMDKILGKYVAYVLKNGGEKQSMESEQFTENNSNNHSMMNTFFMSFQMKLYAKLKVEDKTSKQRKKGIRLTQLHLVVLNNVFDGISHEKLLKFDIKGTFSPGSAVQKDQKQKWYTGEKSWEKSMYREYDFIGISREKMQIDAFFKEGIQLAANVYQTLQNRVKNDQNYLSTNNLNDYSLLLGVQFMNPEPPTDGTAAASSEPEEAKSASSVSKIGKNCVPAICNNCKRRPDAKYENGANLCLYMAIVDIVTPSNEKTEAFFLKIMQEHRNDKAEFAHYTKMEQFNGYQNEVVTPVPPKVFAKRFVGTIFGCLFSPKASTAAERTADHQFKMGIRKSICQSLGERRGKEANGIAMYGQNMFKEMMEKRGNTDAWKMLLSMSDSLLTPGSAGNFSFEKISVDQFANFGTSLSPKKEYVGLFSHGNEYFAVVHNEEKKASAEQKTKRIQKRQRK